MSKNKNTEVEEVMEMDEAMEAVTEEVEKVVYTNAEGAECSRAAFIKEQFVTENKSRKMISEEFDIPYRAVYSATVNMENDAPATSKGRSAAVIKITLEDGTEVLRADYIKEQLEAGVSRGQLATDLGISYQAVYGASKGIAGTNSSAKIEITLEDGSVIGRTAYIKQLFAEGMTRGDIRKKIEEVSGTCSYQVVYNATSEKKIKPFITIVANTLEELNAAYEEARIALKEKADQEVEVDTEA